MRVFSARKSKAGKTITCRVCSAKIKPRETYYYYFKRFSRRMRGTKTIHCSKHYPRPSDLTSSKMGQVYDAQKDFSQALVGAEDGAAIAQAIGDVIAAAEDVKQEYEDSLNNMPEHLQETSDSGQGMREKIDALEDWISELESAQGDVENWEFNESDVAENETPEDATERQLEEAKTEAENVVDSLSV